MGRRDVVLYQVAAIGSDTDDLYRVTVDDLLGRLLTKTTLVGTPQEEVTTFVYDEARVGYLPHTCSLLLSASPILFVFEDASVRSTRFLRLDLLPVPSIYPSTRPELDRSPVCRDHACMISSFVRTQPLARPQTQTLSY